eukprot:11096291-Alexandrium_andersonii.AAC.1
MLRRASANPCRICRVAMACEEEQLLAFWRCPRRHAPRRLDRAIPFVGSRDSGAILSRSLFATGNG